MKILAALVIAAAACAGAMAQEPSAPPECKAPTCEKPKITKGDPAAYSEADKAAGVQGEATVVGKVQLDGSITDIALTESSRSSVLDEAALAAVKSWTYQPGKQDGVPVVMTFVARMEFAKDSLSNLADKTCADLNADVSYFQKTFPEKGLRDMRIARLSSGMVFIAYKGPKNADWLKRVTGAFEKTVAWCAAHPKDKYLERYLKDAK